MLSQKSQKRSLCPPPRNFRPAGRLREVRLELRTPGFVKPRKVSGVRAAGISYERKCQAMLMEAFPLNYVQGPWFSFFIEGQHKLQYCQPDGLLIDIKQGLITIVEIKLRHTTDAWWQTRHLYVPVVGKLFGDKMWKYSIIEVVKWFDPDVVFPEKFQMLRDISHTRPGEFGVHIWGRV